MYSFNVGRLQYVLMNVFLSTLSVSEVSVTAVTVWVRGVTAQLHVADKQSVMPSTRCSRVSVHPVQQAAEQCAILSLFCQYIDDGAKTFSLLIHFNSDTDLGIC